MGLTFCELEGLADARRAAKKECGVSYSWREALRNRTVPPYSAFPLRVSVPAPREGSGTLRDVLDRDAFAGAEVDPLNFVPEAERERRRKSERAGGTGMQSSGATCRPGREEFAPSETLRAVREKSREKSTGRPTRSASRRSPPVLQPAGGSSNPQVASTLKNSRKNPSVRLGSSISEVEASTLSIASELLAGTKTNPLRELLQRGAGTGAADEGGLSPPMSGLLSADSNVPGQGYDSAIAVARMLSATAAQLPGSREPARLPEKGTKGLPRSLLISEEDRDKIWGTLDTIDWQDGGKSSFSADVSAPLSPRWVSREAQSSWE